MSFRTNQHRNSVDDHKQTDDDMNKGFRHKSLGEDQLLADVAAGRESTKKIFESAKTDDPDARLDQVKAQLKAAQTKARQLAKEIKNTEEAQAAEVDRLTKISQDESAGRVRRGSAIQLLAQINDSDPLPLRKAKLDQEAILRKLASLLDEKMELEKLLPHRAGEEEEVDDDQRRNDPVANIGFGGFHLHGGKRVAGCLLGILMPIGLVVITGGYHFNI